MSSVRPSRETSETVISCLPVCSSSFSLAPWQRQRENVRIVDPDMRVA